MSSFHRNWSGLFHSALCQFLREVEEFIHIPMRFFTLLDLTVCFNYCTFESQLCETTFRLLTQYHMILNLITIWIYFFHSFFPLRLVLPFYHPCKRDILSLFGPFPFPLLHPETSYSWGLLDKTHTSLLTGITTKTCVSNPWVHSTTQEFLSFLGQGNTTLFWFSSHCLDLCFSVLFVSSFSSFLKYQFYLHSILSPLLTQHSLWEISATGKTLITIQANDSQICVSSPEPLSFIALH